jgi:hypothetical protein
MVKKDNSKSNKDKKYNIMGLDVVITNKIPNLQGNRIVLGESIDKAVIMFKGKKI